LGIVDRYVHVVHGSECRRRLPLDLGGYIPDRHDIDEHANEYERPTLKFPAVGIHSRRAIVEYLSQYNRLLEVGIGRRTDVAEGLIEAGCTVVATDIYDFEVPSPIEFHHDDLVERSTASEIPTYYDVDVLYALNLPGELHRPFLVLADRLDVRCYFTTLGFEPPEVNTEQITLPAYRSPLYVVVR